MTKLAVISGASSGIGKALAAEFAQGGYNLFLTGRNSGALNTVANYCRVEHNVDCEVFVADLSDPVATDNLASTIANRPVDILVNNAGFGVKGEFSSVPIGTEIDLVNVQLTAMLKLTRAVLPNMIAGKAGKILQIASVYSFSPVPLQSVYGACKAFILSFSSAIRDEVRESGITVTVFCPGITETEFRVRAGIADKGKFAMTATDAAHIAFRETLNGKHIVIPGIENKIFAFLAKTLPGGLITALLRLINNVRGVNGKPKGTNI